MMNILIINQPLNNRGDESAHKGLVRALSKKFPQYKIRVLFIGANDDSVKQFDVNIANVEYINLKPFKGFNKVSIAGLKYDIPFFWYLHPTIMKVRSIYNESDYILCAPGGICMGGFQDWMHLFMLKLAKELKKPLVYYGRSFGPFPTETRNNRIFKKISIEMLNYFSFLSIRDKKTEEIAKELNVHYYSTVDSAFLDSPRVQIPIEIQEKIGEEKYIVFVPNLLIWHYKYKNKIFKENMILFYRQIISIITQKYPNLKIVFLPQTFNYGTYHGDDIYFFKDIIREIEDSRLIIVEDKYSSDIQQAIVAKATLLIGARYHSIVFAINNNIPFIALSYEHKIAGLLSTLNKSNRMVDISHLNNDDNLFVLNQIKSLIQVIDEDNEIVKEKAKRIADDCFDKLVAYLNNTFQ